MHAKHFSIQRLLHAVSVTSVRPLLSSAENIPFIRTKALRPRLSSGEQKKKRKKDLCTFFWAHRDILGNFLTDVFLSEVCQVVSVEVIVRSKGCGGYILVLPFQKRVVRECYCLIRVKSRRERGGDFYSMCKCFR